MSLQPVLLSGHSKDGMKKVNQDNEDNNDNFTTDIKDNKDYKDKKNIFMLDNEDSSTPKMQW